jgi:hypothetical protein
MQQLRRGAGWVKAITLPRSAKIIENLLNKGWIEKCCADNALLPKPHVSADLAQMIRTALAS